MRAGPFAVKRQGRASVRPDAEKRSFISRAGFRGRIAQSVEHSPYKAGVTGSNPVPPTINNATLI